MADGGEFEFKCLEVKWFVTPDDADVGAADEALEVPSSEEQTLIK